jgi:hypothetical protein
MMTMVAIVACIGAWSCGDNDNSAPQARPSAALQCEVVGKVCHDAESDAGQACHELGHDGVPSTCAAEFPGCIDLCLDGGGDHGDPFCRALGSLCHEVDDDDGPLHACHELGHDAAPTTCRQQFDHCAQLCLAAIDAAR